MRTYLWNSLAPDIESALDRVLNSWVKTRHGEGQRVKGMLTDCVQLMGGVFDELYKRTSPTPIPRLRPDTGSHCLASGFEALRAIRNGYPCDVAEDGAIEPGDMVVTRSDPRPGPPMPGHCLVAGTARGQFLHCDYYAGVCFTCLTDSSRIVRVYRFKNKEQWV